MMGDKKQFFALEKKKGRFITFGDNGKEKIISISKIQITSSIFINNILLVDDLKHNLLSINQLCAKDFEVVFKLFSCIFTSPFDNSIKFIGLGMATFT